MITKDQLIQIASWLRPSLRLDDLPNNSWNAYDPSTRAKICCAVTGCETRSNALALIKVETSEAMTVTPAMWQLEVTAAKDRRETRRQIPLCYEHAQVIARQLAKGMPLPRGTSFAPIRQIVAAAKVDRYAKFYGLLDNNQSLVTPPPTEFGLRARDLVAGFIGIINLVTLSEQLPEDEQLYSEAYARYDELTK